MTKSMQLLDVVADEIFTFAVAQMPFENPSPGGTTVNVFCTVVPLWHEDWEATRPAQFPNNGLVWWKLRPSMRPFATPGRLLSGRIERAPRYVESDPHKQYYQLASDVDVLPPEEGIEILTASTRAVQDARDLLNQDGVLTTDHAPTPEVLVRVGPWIYGPFRTRVVDVQRGRHSISLDPVESGGVQRIEAARLDPAVLRMNDVAISLDSLPPTRSNNITLCRYEVIDGASLAEFRQHAVRLVVTRDQDVLMRLARRLEDAGDRRRLEELLGRLAQLTAEAPDDDIDANLLVDALRRQLAQRGRATLELARSILATGMLDAQIAKAVEAAAAEQLAARAAEIEEAARARIGELEAELQKLEARREGLDAEIRTRLRESEELTQKRIEEAWAQHAQQVAAEQARLEAEIAVHRGWQPPAFVSAARETDSLDERAFFERFVDHVEGSGFGFRAIDLQMFHVAFKASEVVAVSGPPGSGRSSLAELYAEALAASELRGTGPQEPTRFLRVPVRSTWVDANDLFGHINPFDNSFVPAANGSFLQLISAAEEYMLHRNASGVYPILLEDADPTALSAWFDEVLRSTRGSQRQRGIRVFSPHVISERSPFRRWHTVEVSPAVRWVITLAEPANGRVHASLAGCPIVNLRVPDDVTTGGASRGAPDGAAVRLAHLLAWRREGPLSTAHMAALDALTPVLARAGAEPAPATIRLLRRVVAGAAPVVSADAAFDYALAGNILRLVPLDTQLIGELLDRVEDLQLRLPESARVLEERRALAERHGI